jgi:hypothetical protein
MDALIILMLLCALGPLALRFGYDSRDLVRSQEHELALRAVEWSPNGPVR